MERLKRTELRLGNLVLNNEGKYCSVIHIEVDPMGDEYMFSPCFGIPITPEILEKAGFEYRPLQKPKSADGEVWGILNTTILYGLCDDGTKAWFLNGYHNDVEIKYIHQLQNLYFALTGRELEINL